MPLQRKESDTDWSDQVAEQPSETECIPGGTDCSDCLKLNLHTLNWDDINTDDEN